jgi:acetylglutamate kinase
MTMSKLTQATERNKTKPIMVIKLGGSILYQLSATFFTSLKEIQKDYNCVIVHGGGPEISKLLNGLGIASTFVDGQRKTTDDVLSVVEMVLGGKVNVHLTSQLRFFGISSIGLTGYDVGLLTASPINKANLGLVGEITNVNVELIQQLLSFGYLPVIAPLAISEEGEKLNVNADLGASAIASALKAEKLLFVTDVPGILKENTLLSKVTKQEINELIEKGVIYGGMIPKVKAAISSLSSLLKEVVIVSGEKPIYQNGNINGTVITEEEDVVKS